MKKLILWGFVIAIALGLILPGGVGFLAERHYPQAVGQLDQSVADWRITLEEFDRGWFTSSVVLAADPIEQGSSRHYESTLTHGPVAGGLNWLSDSGRLRQGNESLAEINWQLQFPLHMNARLELSPSRQHSGTLEFIVSRAMKQIDFQLSDFSISADPGLQLTSATGSGTWINQDGFWTGDIALAADHLRGPGINADSSNLSLSLKQSGELALLELRLSGGALNMDQAYRDWNARLSLSRLHRPTLDAAVGGIVQSLNADLAPAHVRGNIQSQLVFSLPLLLQFQPEIRLEQLSFDTDAGPAQGSAGAALIAPPPAGYLADPILLSQVLRTNWNWELPEPLLRGWLEAQLRRKGFGEAEITEQTTNFMSWMKNNDLMVQNQSRFQSTMNLEREVLTLNGQVKPLPSFR